MRAAVAALALVFLLPVAASPAFADCQVVYTPVLIDGVVVLHAEEVCTGEETGSTTLGAPTTSGLDAICVSTALTVGQDPYTFCLGPPDEQAVVTPGLVRTALEQVPLPPSALEVEPPNGRTLVNFDTNFFTSTVAFSPPPFTLLGQQVEVALVPAQFTWRFGDGEVLTTDQPGSPYPQLDVTHRYLAKGSVSASVDTTWTATYRVNGGPWAPVPGSLTVPGPPVGLTVVTATPTLVG